MVRMIQPRPAHFEGQGPRPEDLEEARSIVLQGLRGHRARVWLFGSSAAGGACRTSDIDVGVLPLEPMPPGLLGDLREILDSSRILYPVDLVDLSRADAALRDRVEREGIPWTS